MSEYEFCKGALCDSCLPNAAIIYRKEISQLAIYEEKFSSLWTECQRCQGSFMEEILCTK